MKNDNEIELKIYCGTYHLDNCYFNTLEETKEAIEHYSLEELNDDLKQYAKDNTLWFYVYNKNNKLIYETSK